MSKTRIKNFFVNSPCLKNIIYRGDVYMKLSVENYDNLGNKLNPKKITLNYPLIYTLLKKYLKEI